MEKTRLQTLSNKQFLNRYQKRVKEQYLYTAEEIQQNLRTLNLFQKFDADGSGALDSQELEILYNENGIMVTEEEIINMYGVSPVLFTLDMFTSITKDKNKLRNYRNVLRKLRVRLAA